MLFFRPIFLMKDQMMHHSGIGPAPFEAFVRVPKYKVSALILKFIVQGIAVNCFFTCHLHMFVGVHAAYACYFAHMHACHFIYSCYQQGTCTILLSMWLVYPHQYISILKGMLCLPIAPSKSIYKSCIRFRIICIFHFLWIFLPSFFRSKQLMLGYAIVSGLLCSPYGFKSLSVGYGLPWLFRSKRLIILSIFWRELQLRVCWCTYLTCCAPKITRWTSTLLVVSYPKLTFI